MRVTRIAPVCALLAVGLSLGALFPGTAVAQPWINYENREYGFAINFPGDPEIEDTTYMTANGASLPARVFSSEVGPDRYTVRVVDFSMHVAGESAAVEYAASAMRQKGEVVYEVVSDLDEVYGPQFMIIEPDDRQLLATIVYFNNRLYIAEGSVSSDSAPPSQFQQSMMLVNEDGSRPNGAGLNADRIARERAYEEQQQQE